LRAAWGISRNPLIAVILFCLPLLSLVTGCGTSAQMGATAVPTVAISASPSSIASGASAVLTVTATNAISVTVSGSDGSTYTLGLSGGTQTVTPTATVTYTAAATGASSSVTASAVVNVTAAATPPPTVTLSASPALITAGTSATLTVTATNATAVTITGTDGSSYSMATSGGTQTVTPSVSTTYTATATGAGGSVTATAMVTVTPAAPSVPTVTISANPASITSGSSSVLTVGAANATSVTISGTDGSSYTLQPSGGMQSVTPAATTTYTATATGAGGSAMATAAVTVTPAPAPAVTITASPTTITSGSSSKLTVTATNATTVTIAGSDTSSYTLQPTGGTQSVSPAATTIYTVTATGAGGSATATATVAVIPAASLQSINHVIFMLQENHTFDNYFGMLNPYRVANGWTTGADGNTYSVDGIDDKLNTISNQSDSGTSYAPFKFTSTCVDDMTSSWLESYGDVSTYDFSATRSILMEGYVHTAEDYANDCATNGGTGCAGTFSPNSLTGQQAMGYYDEGFLNYYYYMASQFAVSDRWFSPLSSKSIPNRIATFTGGTTQGLVFDPGGDDDLPQLDIPNIFSELDANNVSWKIYYTVTQAGCLEEDDCQQSASDAYPATDFSYLSYSQQYLYENPNGDPCAGTTQPSSVVGDTSNSFCIDPNHIAPLSGSYGYYTDLTNGTLPAFAFIEAGYGNNDEHPGSGQSILLGQQEVATIVNSLMTSSSWPSSVFFLAYDEGGGPYDHVPPVPGHSNDYTDATVGSISSSDIPDISTIAVNADSYNPCEPPSGTLATTHCDLRASDPGTSPTDAAAEQGFAAQLGFRVPNMIISPFTRAHYVSHTPMDHTAVLKFVENRFIGPSAHLTQRDAAQPNLLDIFDFAGTPWATPPTPPVPVSDPNGTTCTPANFAPQ